MQHVTAVGGKFSLGKMLMTRGMADLCAEDSEFSGFVLKCIGRHTRGDWGDLCDEDKQENEFALRRGDLRLFSSYPLPIPGIPTIWLITEADRSAVFRMNPLFFRKCLQCFLQFPGLRGTAQ